MSMQRADPGCTSFMCLAIGIVLVCSACVQGCREIRMKAGGATTNATVDYTYTKAVKQKSIQVAEYSFQVNGKRYSGSTQGRGMGETLQVEYLPGNPRDNRVKGTSFWMPGGFLCLLGSIALVAVFLAYLRRSDDLLSE